MFGRLLVLFVALGSTLMGGPVRDGGKLDGFTIGWIPAGVGAQVSDFPYEWEDVSFVSRVWEHEVDGVSQVDLKIAVMRGPRLATLADLRAFLAEYHEYDPAAWRLDEFQNGGHRGFINASEAFWLSSAGVGVSVRIPSGGVTREELYRTAASIRPT
ncbi:hypothetical protein [Acrocarpospora sp. B8E8]|uniref:hypothetical protein n=1 Tax=Acrocarpospora sp. B8E8 TaxID=3153572 RepID=UPI00325DA890